MTNSTRTRIPRRERERAAVHRRRIAHQRERNLWHRLVAIKQTFPHNWLYGAYCCPECHQWWREHGAEYAVAHDAHEAAEEALRVADRDLERFWQPPPSTFTLREEMELEEAEL